MSSPDYSSDDSSDHSYDEQRHQSVCSFQTPRYHDQECSRFFDCPTHTIERAGSDGAASEEEQAADESQGQGQEHTEPEAHAAADDEDADEQGRIDGQHDEARAGSPDMAPSSVAEPSGEQETAGTARQGGNDESSRVVIDLTSSSPEQGHAEAGSQQTPQVIDLTGDSPPTEAISRARAEKSRQERALPTIPAPEASSSSAQERPGSVSPSSQRRPATPPSPPPPVRRRTSSNNFGTAPRPAPLQTQMQSQPQRPSQVRRTSEVILPRWQPDAEVTICPICRTQFSFLVRKHHCRYVFLSFLESFNLLFFNY